MTRGPGEGKGSHSYTSQLWWVLILPDAILSRFSGATRPLKSCPSTLWCICIEGLHLILTSHFLPRMPAAGGLHRSCPGLPAQMASRECHTVRRSGGCSLGTRALRGSWRHRASPKLDRPGKAGGLLWEGSDPKTTHSAFSNAATLWPLGSDS